MRALATVGDRTEWRVQAMGRQVCAARDALAQTEEDDDAQQGPTSAVTAGGAGRSLETGPSGRRCRSKSAPRRGRDWARTGAIGGELETLRIVVMDRPDGVCWRVGLHEPVAAGVEARAPGPREVEMGMLLSWIVLSVAVWLAALLLPGFRIASAGDAVVVALLIGLLNFFVGKVLFVLIGVGTLGLGFVFAFATRWFVNAIVLKIADAMTDRLTIDSFGQALLASLVMSGVGTAAQWLLR